VGGKVVPGLHCPICKAQVAVPAENPGFPFCSPRCRMVDLGRWIDGRYAVDMKTGKLDTVDPEDPDVEVVDPETSGDGYH